MIFSSFIKKRPCWQSPGILFAVCSLIHQHKNPSSSPYFALFPLLWNIVNKSHYFLTFARPATQQKSIQLFVWCVLDCSGYQLLFEIYWKHYALWIVWILESRLTSCPASVDFDLLIAAAALTNILVIGTDNEKHFFKIADLKIQNWSIKQADPRFYNTIFQIVNFFYSSYSKILLKKPRMILIKILMSA